MNTINYGALPPEQRLALARGKHPEQAEGDLAKLVLLLRHGDAMPGEQDLAADHLERLVRIEQAEGAQGESYPIVDGYHLAPDTRYENETCGCPDILIDSCSFKGLNEDSSAPFTVKDGKIVKVDLRGWSCYGPLQAEDAQGELGAEAERKCKFLAEFHGVSVDQLKQDLAPAFAALAQPSPSPELERPVVVGYAVDDSTGYALHVSLMTAKEEAFPNGQVEELMTVAQYDRIVGALRAEVGRWHEASDQAMQLNIASQKELRAAQARVAELETELAMALDAAAKGDDARAILGGMELEKKEPAQGGRDE